MSGSTAEIWAFLGSTLTIAFSSQEQAAPCEHRRSRLPQSYPRRDEALRHVALRTPAQSFR